MIFAIILTIAYVLYYGFNICRDIIGNKGEAKSDTQTFDMEPSPGEKAVEIDEVQDTDEPPDRTEPDASENAAIKEGEAEGSAEEEEILNAISKVEDELEECEPCTQFSLNDKQLNQALAEPESIPIPAVYTTQIQ